MFTQAVIMEQETKESSPGEILIIEDTLASLQLLSGLMEGAGYAVRTAQDGELGLKSAQKLAPDLVLLDIRMPGMDGYEVCRRLKADPGTAGVPVIFLSALQDAGSKIKGFRLGAVDYITKPYEAEEVLVRVHTHVELYKLHTSLKNEVQSRTMKLEQEIAERKRAEDEARHAREKLEASVQQMPVAYIQFDDRFRVAEWNKAAESIFGFTRDEILGKYPIGLFVPEEAGSMVEDAMRKLLNGIVADYSAAGNNMRKDGTVISCRWHNRPLVGKDGKITGVLSMAEDVTERVRAEEALRASEERYRRLFADSAAVMLILDPADGRIVDANTAACAYYGYTLAQLKAMKITGINTLSLEQAQAEMKRAREQKKKHFEFCHRLANGEVRDVEVSSGPIEIDGRTLLLSTVTDVTERKRAEQALRLQSEITANAAEGISLVKASDGVIHYTNRQFELLFGYAPGELTGKHISIINAPTEKLPQETASDIMRAIEKHGVWNGEVLNRKKDGATFWTSADISTFRHPELGTLLISYQRDITEKKETEEMIWAQANFDALTGLPNRHMFHDRLAQEIRKADRASQQIALMFIDLDRFKEVNDTLGHDMGDILLVEAARRIGECARATDMVARMGGDEFTVTLTDITDIGSIERVAQNILQKLAEPFHLGNEIAFVSGSIGITLYPDDAAGVEELLKNADQTMYVAKGLGRNRHSYFTHELQKTAQARLGIVNDLRGALAANQFMVHFQPIVDMASGSIYKAEALIRWQHPERGMVGPQEFIPLAEETGLIFEIGDWVFHESARLAKRWRELHHPGFQVSVNKSPVQFYKHGDGQSAWVSHLNSIDLPGQSIVIEITEGLLMGAEPAIGDALFTLRDAGIQIAIDDFGTGYSSLAYLNRFNIDYLKIDQSFTRNITPDSNEMALCEAIVVMAHKLGLKVIAEGVETAHQRDLLSDIGCDYAQGYLYSRPVPPEEFEALLKNWKG